MSDISAINEFNIRSNLNREYDKFEKLMVGLPYELFFLVWKTIIRESCYLREMVQLINLNPQLDDIVSLILRETNIELISKDDTATLKLENQQHSIKLGTQICDKLIGFIKKNNIKLPKAVLSSLLIYPKSDNLYQIFDSVSKISLNHTVVHSFIRDYPNSKGKITEVMIRYYKNDLVGDYLHAYNKLPNLQSFNITSLCNEHSTNIINSVLQFIAVSNTVRSLRIMLMPLKEDGIPTSLTFNIESLLEKRPSLNFSLILMKNLVTHTDIDFDQFLQQTKLFKSQINALSSHIRAHSSIYHISEYKNLDNLSLGMDDSLTDLSALSFTSPKLKLLALQHWTIKDINFFNNFPKLQTLALTSCNLSVKLNLPLFLKKIVFQKCKFSNILTFPQTVKQLNIIASNFQEFPRIHELPSHTKLSDVSLKLSSCNSLEYFLISLPPTLKSLDLAVSPTSWEDFNFSFLKQLQEFSFSAYGYGVVFDLSCLPPNIKKLRLDVRDATYKNTLPRSLKTFNFTTNEESYTASLNRICFTCELDSLIIRSPNLFHNLLDFNFKQLKILLIFADCQNNPEIFTASCLVLLLPRLPSSLYRFEFLINNELVSPINLGLELRLTQNYNKGLDLLGFSDNVIRKTFI